MPRIPRGQCSTDGSGYDHDAAVRLAEYERLERLRCAATRPDQTALRQEVIRLKREEPELRSRDVAERLGCRAEWVRVVWQRYCNPL